MEPLIECRVLKKYFNTDSGTVQAVDGISFSIFPGETVGLVGESGCGKSTVGRTLLKLIQPSAGEVLFEGENIFDMDRNRLDRLKRKMGIVFQNPYSSLNPRMKVADIVAEPIRTHRKYKKDEIRRLVIGLLEKVGLNREHLTRFPHQFSGGQRQRIAIARSLSLNPSFLIFDEPTSALDVSVQAQVLNLIEELQEQNHLTYLFITHDLDVVRHIADRVMVMYLGKLVESGPVPEVFESPQHPYTKALLSAIPGFEPGIRKERELLEGEVPSPIDPPPGCRFHPRCPVVIEKCGQIEPELKTNRQRQVACHLCEM